jgi:hypothetical protein
MSSYLGFGLGPGEMEGARRATGISPGDRPRGAHYKYLESSPSHLNGFGFALCLNSLSFVDKRTGRVKRGISAMDQPEKIDCRAKGEVT